MPVTGEGRVAPNAVDRNSEYLRVVFVKFGKQLVI